MALNRSKLSLRLPFVACIAGAFVTCDSAHANNSITQEIVVDTTANQVPFDHFWEKSFGSDRSDMVLTESYLKNAERTKAKTNFSYVRFHGILDDTMGILKPDGKGGMSYNFRKVDAVYDALLARHIRPLVELSFMPSLIGSDVLRRDGGLEPLLHSKASDPIKPITDYSGGTLWYHANVTPPAHMAQWNALIHAFATHLEARYGRDEVRQWPFEVWNEPDQATWKGQPRQSSYFDLYDNTARTIKDVDPGLKVGGPATGAIHWVSDFIDHVTTAHAPVDFISTHIYANDPPALLKISASPDNTGNTVCDATRSVRTTMDHSSLHALPLYITEFGADWDINNGTADRAWVAPWLAQTIHDCAGLTPIMSYWTFSDDFEEQGVLDNELPGAYGLLTTHGIPKLSFNAFSMLHQLGNERLHVQSGPSDVLATRRTDGTIAIALWNQDQNQTKQTVIDLKGASTTHGAQLTLIDQDHGSPTAEFLAMGKPQSPSPAQVAQLQQAARLPSAIIAKDCTNLSHCGVRLPPQSLALLIIPATRS